MYMFVYFVIFYDQGDVEKYTKPCLVMRGRVYFLNKLNARLYLRDL